MGLPDERVYRAWFPAADTDGDGRVTGPDAVHFFTRSGLPREALSRVWVMSDHGRQGYLSVLEFIKAMRAIALTQHDLPFDAETLSTPLDYYAAMEGLPIPAEGQDAATATEALRAALPTPPPKPVPPPPKPASNKPNKHGIRQMNMAQCTGIIDALKEVYKAKVRPIEEAYKFGAFFSPLLTDADFDGKPQVLLLGQYSTGKTTFIKHLLQRDYPGCHIGPEPTTDRFVIVNHGHEERITPGNTLCVMPDKPYTGLTAFGTGFLSKFQSASCPARLLEEITIVDTPGVLSGEKQRIERSYNFIEVCEWFAARCDVILLLFDPHKLDISDEFKSVIATLKGHDDKVRVILNKADQVDAQQLMRVYGALMWSLGKVFNTPEVVKVYVGSFNARNQAADGSSSPWANNPLGSMLFEKEQQDLLADLYAVPSRSTDRKVNEFVKRVRAARTHMLIVGNLRKQMPQVFGHDEKQKKLLNRLDKEFEKCQVEYQLPRGDLPNVDRYRQILSGFDFKKFPQLEKKWVQTMDEVLHKDIPAIMRKFENPF